MIVRILYRKDGGVSIIYPAEKSRRAEETEKDWLTRVFEKANPDNLSYEDIDLEKTSLPTPRFRNAWVKGNKGVTVDLSRAKAQVLDEIRAVRNARLDETDKLMSRALETGTVEELEELKRYRQQLRDLPQTIGIDKIKTVDKLLAAYPEKVTAEDCLNLVGS